VIGTPYSFQRQIQKRSPPSIQSRLHRMEGLKLPKRVSRKANEPNDAPIQQTNDDAQISKLSAVEVGYMKDNFVRLFVKKPMKRAPLINRGYFARSYALDNLIDRFLKAGNQVQKQIISLGAGFDTRFFQLQTSETKSNIAKYIEIDFPEVVASKIEIIQSNPQLLALINSSTGDSTQLHSNHYHIFGTDLRDISQLKEKLIACGTDFSLPTLFISECVLIYMDASDSDKILQWVSESFSTAVFITYEMIKPDDPFGQTMLRNLENRSIILKGIRAYPDLEQQKQRYFKTGWQHANAEDMFGIYNKYTPKEELKRISKLELFDEFEEWELISRHYCISWATQTSLDWKSQELDLSEHIKFILE